MSEQPGPAGVVPYVEWHTGPRRSLTIDLHPRPGALSLVPPDRIAPTVGIDGRQYVVYWGRVSFEVPADRAVHVAVSLQEGVAASSLLIPPGDAVRLDYVADLGAGRATLTPPAAPAPPQA
jgi:hypothetical protein